MGTMITHNTGKYQNEPIKVEYPQIQEISSIKVFDEGDCFILEFYALNRPAKILYQIEISDTDAIELSANIVEEYINE